MLEGNIQHENRDQHRHEEARRGCLQNSIPRQHLVEDQNGCDAAAKEGEGKLLIPSSGADKPKARPALVAASEVMTNVNSR